MFTKHKFLGFISIILLVVLDQITKVFAVSGLKDKEAIVLIKNVLELRYLENNGAAFSMLQGQKWFFLVITTIIVIILIVLYIRMPETKRFFLARSTVILLIAGAIGNYIDRGLHTYVVDFIYFRLIDFPIFNVADIYVTVACALLFICILFVYKDQEFNDLLGIKKKDK